MSSASSPEDPTIALVSVVTRFDVETLDRHLDAIKSQSRAPDEHLWLCAKGPTPELRQALKDTTRNTSPQAVTSISELLNQTNADFLWLVPTDAEPTPAAVESIIFDIHVYGAASLIFGDEYFTQTGRDPQPIFRPNFSPFTQTSQEPIGRHPIIKRSDIAQTTAGYAPGEEASSLALNCYALGLRIRQLPSLLAHFRGAAPPTVSGERHSCQRSPSDNASAELISIIIPSAGFPSKSSGRPAILDLADSLTETLDKRTEVIVVADDGFDAKLVPLIRDRLPVSLRFIQHRRQGGGFNFARMANQGALSALGEILVLINDDVTYISPGWIDVVRARLQSVECGALGAWINDPSGQLWHRGITTQPADGGLPICGGVQTAAETKPRTIGQENVALAAVGALLSMRKTAFWSVGAMSALFPDDHNEVDLCLKFASKEMTTHITSLIQATHDPGTSRGVKRNLDAEVAVQIRWQAQLASDPWRNPNIAHETLNPVPDWLHWERQQPALDRGIVSSLMGQQHDQTPSHIVGDSIGLEVWASVRENRLVQPRRRVSLTAQPKFTLDP